MTGDMGECALELELVGLPGLLAYQLRRLGYVGDLGGDTLIDDDADGLLRRVRTLICLFLEWAVIGSPLGKESVVTTLLGLMGLLTLICLFLE